MKISEAKIGFIGAGNMGGAIVRGIIKVTDKKNITVFDTDRSRISELQNETGVSVSDSVPDVIKFSDMIILAVKPDIILKLMTELNSYKGIIISIAAGISIKTLQNISGEDKKLFRTMPNTPVTVGCGMTVISPSKTVTQDETDLVMSLFSSVGEVLVMDEKHMNGVTAVSGSGPAYLFTFIQAMADAAVKLGIPRKEALMLAGQTILGSAKMFLDKIENPISLRDKVTSPGGTTIAALHVLERSGFSGIIIDAIETAEKRAKELDKT